MTAEPIKEDESAWVRVIEDAVRAKNATDAAVRFAVLAGFGYFIWKAGKRL